MTLITHRWGMPLCD